MLVQPDTCRSAAHSGTDKCCRNAESTAVAADTVASAPISTGCTRASQRRRSTRATPSRAAFGIGYEAPDRAAGDTNPPTPDAVANF